MPGEALAAVESQISILQGYADTGMIGVIGTNLYKRDSQTVDGIYVSDIYEIKNDGSTYTKVCRVTGTAYVATLPS